MFSHHRPNSPARSAGLDYDQDRCGACERECVYGEAVDPPTVVASVSRGRSKRPGESRAFDAPRFGAICLGKMKSFSSESEKVDSSLFGQDQQPQCGWSSGDLHSLETARVWGHMATNKWVMTSDKPRASDHSRKMNVSSRSINGRPRGARVVNQAPLGLPKNMNCLTTSKIDEIFIHSKYSPLRS